MKKYDDSITDGFTILGAVAFIVFIVFIAPWINFWFAYFGGWIAKLLIGKYLVKGFALIGITLSIDKIPLLAGTLGWIGGFFKVKNINTNKNKDK